MPRHEGRDAYCRLGLGLGRLCRRTGRRAEAQQHLTANTPYHEMDMRFWHAQVEAELDARA
jgi:hypothetical protein